MCLLLGPQGPGPGGPGPGTQGPGPGARAPGPKVHRFSRTTDCARILIEGARFPPFGFAIAEISSSSNEYVSSCQKDLLWHDSDRGHSVSPLRVRYSGDKPRSPKYQNPPRPLASRRVEAVTNHPNLQDLKQAHKGEVYPPPSPSQTVRPA